MNFENIENLPINELLKYKYQVNFNFLYYKKLNNHYEYDYTYTLDDFTLYFETKEEALKYVSELKKSYNLGYKMEDLSKTLIVDEIAILKLNGNNFLNDFENFKEFSISKNFIENQENIIII